MCTIVHDGTADATLLPIVQEDAHAHGTEGHLGHVEIEDAAVEGARPFEIAHRDLEPVHRVVQHFHGVGGLVP